MIIFDWHNQTFIMANKLPPPKKTEVSESEVIDPHFRVTFPLPKEEGWTDWTEENRALYINNLSVHLTYDGNTYIPATRTYSAGDFQEIPAPFDLSKFDDNVSYYNASSHYLTLYINFADANFKDHNVQEWKATIKLAGNIISDYDSKVLPFQPTRNH